MPEGSILSDKRAECWRRGAMACDAFERGRDLEERWLIEPTRKELQSNRQLDFFRAFQTAAVRIAVVRHSIVDFSGESGGNDNRRKAGLRAETDRKARSRASVGVKIGFQHRFARHEIRIGHRSAR